MNSTTTTSYDPYENVVDVMEQAVEIGHINKSMFEIIKNPQRETKVYLPVEMDDGHVEVFEGYRIRPGNRGLYDRGYYYGSEPCQGIGAGIRH